MGRDLKREVGRNSVSQLGVMHVCDIRQQMMVSVVTAVMHHVAMGIYMF